MDSCDVLFLFGGNDRVNLISNTGFAQTILLVGREEEYFHVSCIMNLS